MLYEWRIIRRYRTEKYTDDAVVPTDGTTQNQITRHATRKYERTASKTTPYHVVIDSSSKSSVTSVCFSRGPRRKTSAFTTLTLGRYRATYENKTPNSVHRMGCRRT